MPRSPPISPPTSTARPCSTASAQIAAISAELAAQCPRSLPGSVHRQEQHPLPCLPDGQPEHLGALAGRVVVGDQGPRQQTFIVGGREVIVGAEDPSILAAAMRPA